MSLINPTDLVQLGSSLYSTWSSYYNKPYKYHTRLQAPLIDKPISRIIDILQLKDVKFILKPLNRKINGMTFPASEITYLDPRRETYQELVYTACHEAIHLFQIQNGRLDYDVKRDKFLWDGRPYAPLNCLTEDYDEYLELPWEKDANIKMNSLYLEVMKTDKVPTTWPKLK